MSENEPEAVVDPVSAVHNTLSDLGRDSMCISYACVVEWLEPDGSSSIEVLHTDMAPWHLKGLLDWATKMTGFFSYGDSLYDDDDDDD